MQTRRNRKEEADTKVETDTMVSKSSEGVPTDSSKADNNKQIGACPKKDDQLPQIPSVSEKEVSESDEKKRKAFEAFLYAHVDKIPTLFTSVYLMALATAEKSKNSNSLIFQVLAAVCPSFICISLTLFGFSGHFKEGGYRPTWQYRALSYAVLAEHIILLALLCLVLITLEHASMIVVLLPAGVTAVLLTLAWQIPYHTPKTVLWCLWDMYRKPVPVPDV